MQAVCFPGTSQNVNSHRPGTMFCMLCFAVQHQELSNGSEMMSCVCSMDKGGLSKNAPRGGYPRPSSFIVNRGAFHYLKGDVKSLTLVTCIFSTKEALKLGKGVYSGGGESISIRDAGEGFLSRPLTWASTE